MFRHLKHWFGFAEDPVRAGVLTGEIAVRSRALYEISFLPLLPDPDPILEQTGQTIEVYHRLLADAHVWSCYQSRKSGTLSREWRIEPGGPGSVRAARAARDLVADVTSRLDIGQVISDLLDAVFFGISPVEIIWAAAGQTWIPAQVVGRPPEYFAFGQAGDLRFLARDRQFDGEPLPDRKFLLARHHANYRNPYGQRVLSKCFWPVAFKRGGIKFWSICAEKYGMPWVVGKVPRGTNETERGRLLSSLARMVQDAVAVINNDQSIDLQDVQSRGGSADLYERLCNFANAEISKAILGQTLTTEVGDKGSFAASKTHMEVRGDLVEQDAKMVAGCLNQLFGWITELNLGSAQPPVFTWYEAEDPHKDWADRDAVLVKALSPAGVTLSPAYYQDKYGLRDGDLMPLPTQPETGNPKPETTFADPDPELSAAIDGQKKVDDLMEKSSRAGAKAVAAWVAVIAAFLAAAPSLGQAADGLVGFYNRLDPAAFVEALASALLDADRVGVQSVGGADFAEAFWGPGQPFQEAEDFFKSRAFTIAGVGRADILGDVKDALAKAMRDGSTLRDFQAAFDDICERRGWSGLAPYRVNTIFQTNLQAAYQAGRYRQMTDPAVLKARPYWRYVAVLDASTRPAHAAMHGRIYPADSPAWQTWYPPCGYNCRCTVVSVSADEAQRRGWKISSSDPTGTVVDAVNPVTGQALNGVVLQPDKGWGDRGGSLEKLLDAKQSTGEKGRIIWKEAPDQSGPEALGRPREKQIPPDAWRPGPGKVASLEERIGRSGQSRTEALKAIEAEYKQVMGISPNEAFSFLRGPDGETLKVDLNGLAHAMLKENQGRERFLRYYRDTIERPYEVLLTEYRTETGATKYRKKYVGLYLDEKKEALIITAEVSPEGWTMWNVMNAKAGTIDRQRQAREVLYARDARIATVDVEAPMGLVDKLKNLLKPKEDTAKEAVKEVAALGQSAARTVPRVAIKEAAGQPAIRIGDHKTILVGDGYGNKTGIDVVLLAVRGRTNIFRDAALAAEDTRGLRLLDRVGQIQTKILEGLPEKLQAAVQEIYLLARPNPSDQYWRERYGNPGHESGATGGNRRILLWESAFRAEQISRAKGDQWLIDVMLHEWGHNLGQLLFGKSRTPDVWPGLMEREGWTSDYSRVTKSLSENFAETFRNYIRCPQKTEKQFPGKVDFMRSLLREGSA